MKKNLAVTVMMDAGCIPAHAPCFRGASVPSSTERDVISVLRRLGHTVRVLGVNDSLVDIVRDLTEKRPDLVFNLSEQFSDKRSLDGAVAGILELLDIPFTGAGSLGLALCRNKEICGNILRGGGIRVPASAVLAPGQTAHIPASVRFPVVVKPALEDGSDGISNASLANNTKDALERARLVHQRFNQPAVAEEYVEGRELYVSVVGDRRLTVLPPRELLFGDKEGRPQLATLLVKWNKAYQRKWGIRFDFADIEPALCARLKGVCTRAFRLLYMRDYGRFDLRLTSKGDVVVLEANANPNLGRDDELALSSVKSGLAYTELIQRIVRTAMQRGASLPR